MRADAPRHIEIRRATPADRPDILALMVASLGWAADERHEALFAWKHDDNPFGPSPAWVAVDGDRVLGLRTFMRWEFVHDGVPRRAVRAVDTATHPDARGQGLFRTLTLAALEELEAEGVEWVFNTPNDQSRPGYLKMGWSEVGRLTLSVRPRLSLRGLRRTVATRASHAELWPAEPAAGESVETLVRDSRDALARLVGSADTSSGVRTARSVDYLAWRYGFGALGYRAVTHPDGVERGVALVRVRRRGAARELSMCDVLVPAGDRSAARRLVRVAMAESGADFAAAIGPVPSMLTLGGRGPVLTARTVTATPPASLDPWKLALGDVELF